MNMWLVLGLLMATMLQFSLMDRLFSDVSYLSHCILYKSVCFFKYY